MPLENGASGFEADKDREECEMIQMQSDKVSSLLSSSSDSPFIPDRILTNTRRCVFISEESDCSDGIGDERTGTGEEQELERPEMEDEVTMQSTKFTQLHSPPGLSLRDSHLNGSFVSIDGQCQNIPLCRDRTGVDVNSDRTWRLEMSTEASRPCSLMSGSSPELSRHPCVQLQCVVVSDDDCDGNRDEPTEIPGQCNLHDCMSATSAGLCDYSLNGGDLADSINRECSGDEANSRDLNSLIDVEAVESSGEGFEADVSSSFDPNGLGVISLRSSTSQNRESSYGSLSFVIRTGEPEQELEVGEVEENENQMTRKQQDNSLNSCNSCSQVKTSNHKLPVIVDCSDGDEKKSNDCHFCQPMGVAAISSIEKDNHTVGDSAQYGKLLMCSSYM